MSTLSEPVVEALPSPPGGAPVPGPFPPGALPAGFAGFDPQAMQAFVQKVMGDLSSAVVSLVAALGDRLGLFKALAGQGPATSAELAARAGLDERYTREWLATLSAAGYVAYDPASRRFALPPEHAAVVAHEGGMAFLGGGYQQLLGFVKPLDRLTEAFRTGAGVLQDAYDADLWDGMERMSATWFDNLLVQQWLPALPAVYAGLERGIHVADVGCGGGRALIRLARSFPNATFVGYDAFGGAVDRARAAAARAGVADRVRFEQRDAAAGLPEAYDLVTTFDAAHDFVDAPAVLRAIRAALRPGGTFVMLEMNCSARLEENVGPAAAVLYGTSVLYNLPVARALGGDGAGTMGLPPERVEALCRAAGFGHVRRVPIQNPFNILYEIKP